MPFSVRLTENARVDLRGIGDYLSQNESPLAARRVLDQIVALIEGLAEFPERGAPLRDISSSNLSDYRSLTVRPYRIVYRVTEGTVVVHLIADGRRDMRTLLLHRLLQE